MRNLLISAFGIHKGGGLVLLIALLEAARANLREVLIDQRFVSSVSRTIDAPQVRVIKRTLWSRISGLTSLALRASEDDVLLCFNSLPPLVKSKAYVVVYVHAAQFFGGDTHIRYAALTRLRIFIERMWFARGLKYADEIWVQTSSMDHAVRVAYPKCRVRVVPFVDDKILLHVEPPSGHKEMESGSHFTFFYPADGVSHKNHVTLIKAWIYLVQSGFRPKLQLTLEPCEYEEILRACSLMPDEIDGIENLGVLSREEVIERIRLCSALIFPSLAESFGLPLLEARAFETAIVASERDFVRDVCLPCETFDPQSARSIAAAVKRFILGRDEVTPHLYSSQQFVEKLLNGDRFTLVGSSSPRKSE